MSREHTSSPLSAALVRELAPSLCMRELLCNTMALSHCQSIISSSNAQAQPRKIHRYDQVQSLTCALARCPCLHDEVGRMHDALKSKPASLCPKACLAVYSGWHTGLCIGDLQAWVRRFLMDERISLLTSAAYSAVSQFQNASLARMPLCCRPYLNMRNDPY